MASTPDPPGSNGELSGDYQVGEPIREGWGGTIREGRYLPTGRRVSIEEIRPDLAAQPGLVDRLAQVGRDAASIRDPHVLAVYNLLDDSDGLRLIAEWSDDPTLTQRLRAGSLSAEQGVAIACDVLAGLTVIHGAGMFHGQVGPDTVVVAPDGRARLAELAVCAAAAAPGTDRVADVRDAARLGLRLLRSAGSRLDAVRGRLDAAVVSADGDAAALRTELETAAAVVLGAEWRERRSSRTKSSAHGRRRWRLVLMAVPVLLAIAAGVVSGLLLLDNRSSDTPVRIPLTLGSDAALTVRPPTGGCDTTFDFVGRGSLSGTGTLVYRWEQSDGVVTADVSLPIHADEGAFQLTEAWRLQGSQTVDGGMTLHILKPVDRRLQRSFRYACR